MVWMLGLTACGWFWSSPESDLPKPVATASITNGAAPVIGKPQALTEDQLAELDELFVRTTELVREGEPGAYRSATITFVQTELEDFHPERGEKVSVVPSDPELPPHTLSVAEVAEAELFVQLTTSATEDPAWLTADAPEGKRPEMLGRATLLYPETAGAKSARPPEDLPEGITAGNLVAGIDVSGDGFADIVTSEHCCDDATLPPGGPCDAGTCLMTYVRSATGWRVAEDG